MQTAEAPTREEKRDAFEDFYAGWTAFMEGRPNWIPAEAREAWTPDRARRFLEGHEAATRAAERFRSSS